MQYLKKRFSEKMSWKILISSCLLISSISTVRADCPTQCTCNLDNRGRNTVLCKQGGMTGPLSLAGMDSKIEVLKITAPDHNLNSLTMSPELQNFKHLEEIHITRSNIPILGVHFFFGLKKLDVLNLSQNNITQPLDHNFRGLSSLKELYLDDNRIYSLPSGTFRFLVELRILSIQRNRIKEMMPRIFQQLGKLQVLKLSGNSLGELNPEIFKDIQDLRVLECRGCALEKINTEIYHLIPHLTHLDLGDNELKHISGDEFRDLPRLKSLKLDGNSISRLEENTFSTQVDLEILKLARNGLTSVCETAFENATKLKELDLAYNKLENLDPKVFASLENTLERLVLSGNHIRTTELRQLLVNVASLRDLQLADCGLADIVNDFIPGKLTNLNLAGNYLSSLPDESVPFSLVDLDISRNRFRGLNEDIVQRIEKISRLKLDGNPWSCDLCHIIPLLMRVNSSDAIYNLKCVSPYHQENKLLGSLHRDQLSWCSAPSYTSSDANFFLNADDGKLGIIVAGTSAVLLCVTIVAVLLALFYSRRHAANYYTHEEKRHDERESIFENQSQLFGDERELSFKFPLESEKKISIATIDEIKKDHSMTNGT